MRRIYGYLYKRDAYLTIALLPRLRLSLGPEIGIGLQWLTCWIHVWLWVDERRRKRRMLDLLPHVWLFFNPQSGVYLHVWWWTIRKSWHVYTRQRAKEVA